MRNGHIWVSGVPYGHSKALRVTCYSRWNSVTSPQNCPLGAHWWEVARSYSSLKVSSSWAEPRSEHNCHPCHTNHQDEGGTSVFEKWMSSFSALALPHCQECWEHKEILSDESKSTCWPLLLSHLSSPVLLPFKELCCMCWHYPRRERETPVKHAEDYCMECPVWLVCLTFLPSPPIHVASSPSIVLA